jgi:hypothetical protein
MEVSDQLHAPAALPPGKELLVRIGRKLDGSQGRSERHGGQKILPLPGIETLAVQPGSPWVKQHSINYISHIARMSKLTERRSRLR